MNSTQQNIQFQRAWASELRREHEAVCWAYRVQLTTPMIEIISFRRKWGAWDPDTRAIRISADLITRHSWDIVLNVFKHEMAHQIVTDIFFGDEGHGPLFGRACAMIGVPEPFCRASGDLPRRTADFRDAQLDSKNMRMLERVRKLLSLAQSKNENEAFLAMEKANSLIEKYNVDRIEEDRAAKFTYAIIHHRKKRIENYQRRICRILHEHFFVDVVFASIFDPMDCQTYRTIELLGTVENVRIAEYVYHFLMNQMEILWKAHQRKASPAFRNKRSYRLGVLKGFHDKLDRQARERRKDGAVDAAGSQSVTALILAEDRAFEAFKRMRFPRLTAYRPAGSSIDYATFSAGMDDGQRLVLHQGIGDQDGFQGRLLNQPPKGSRMSHQR